MLHWDIPERTSCLVHAQKLMCLMRKSPCSRLAKSEGTQFTYVNEYFSDKHNSLSRKSGKKLGFSRRHYLK